MKRFKLFSFLLLISTMLMNAQIISEGPSAQYLLPNFTKAKVKMQNGEIHEMIMNYNTVSEMMVYQKNDKLYDLMNTDMTDTIYIEEMKFVSSGGIFYEVLLEAQIPFYIKYKGELLPPGTPAGYGVNSQVSNTKLKTSYVSSTGSYNLELPSDYKVQIDLTYLFKKDELLLSFTNEKQFLKLVPEKTTELKRFIKENRIKFREPKDIKKLAQYFNKIIS